MGAGTVDELAIFNRDLNADEIKKLMEEGIKSFTAVEYAGKLARTWGIIKAEY